MEDKIEKLLLSPDSKNIELALILAKNEGITIEKLPAIEWLMKHVFKVNAVPEAFELNANVIAKFMTKRTIAVAGNLGVIPENLYSLTQLIKVMVDFENNEGVLSNSIANFYKLNILQVKNYSSKLPEALCQLKSLKSLELTNCKDLGEQNSIWEMNWLERLEIEQCGLNTIPASIAKFKDLDYFSMQENPIQELPNELLALPKLKFISCYQCNQLHIPPAQQRLFDERGIVVLK